MTDVFIRATSLQSALRDAMQHTTWVRWQKEENVNVRYIEDRGIREGREYAERDATSDPYIFTDNDVLIVGEDWVKRAISAILAHPEYAAVSSLSLVEGENQATGEGEIYEMHAVGAPMIIRKGILQFDFKHLKLDPHADFARGQKPEALVYVPEMDINSECGVLHKYYLDRGYKEGLVNKLRHNHIGHGFSGNPALFWGY